MNPWDLMVHAQAAHMINIYELGDATKPNDHSAVIEVDKIRHEENGKEEMEGIHSEVRKLFYLTLKLLVSKYFQKYWHH